MQFAERLIDAIRRCGSAALVGIDPRVEDLPGGWLEGVEPTRAGTAAAVEAFGKEVVEIAAGLVPAVKLQAAFYEALGPEGMSALRATARHARGRGLIVVVDGKRNDIGSTADAYARAYLGPPDAEGASGSAWEADALTVNPYLGSDGVAPFVRAAERGGTGVFVLVRTSNPSAREFQDLVADGKPLFRHVADRLAGWAGPSRGPSGYSSVGAVVGATYPEELAELRAALPGVLFLVPGYGAQGGTARDVAAAFDDRGLGALVNSSRGVTFAYEREPYRSRFGADWRRAVEQALRDMIADLAAHTPAGRLRG